MGDEEPEKAGETCFAAASEAAEEDIGAFVVR